MTQLQLLESERDKWIKAKRKSTESYDNNQIPWKLHEEHIKNLDPKIKELSEVVEILKKGLG
jgi:hypothetical protein